MEKDPYDKLPITDCHQNSIDICSIIAAISDVGGWAYPSPAPPRRDYLGTTRAGRD